MACPLTHFASRIASLQLLLVKYEAESPSDVPDAAQQPQTQQKDQQQQQRQLQIIQTNHYTQIPHQPRNRRTGLDSVRHAPGHQGGQQKTPTALATLATLPRHHSLPAAAAGRLRHGGGRPPGTRTARVAHVRRTALALRRHSTRQRHHNKKSPYFVWHKRGRLELAAWPHIVDKMPQPPRFPGYFVNGGRSRSGGGGGRTKTPTTTTTTTAAANADNNDDDNVDEASSSEESEEEEEEESEEVAALHEMQEREASGLSELAWNARGRVPLPTIQYKWISPLRQTFGSRKSAWEHAVQLCKQEVVLDKVLTGYGANGKPLKLAPPTRKTVLEAGKMRFERDGLWVVGQEEVWGLERLEAARHAIDNCTEKDPIYAVINSNNNSINDNDSIKPQQQHDNNPVQAAASATASAVATGPSAAESASSTKKKVKRRLTGLTYFVQCNRESHRQKRLDELRAQNPAAVSTPVSTMTDCTTAPAATAAASSTTDPPSSISTAVAVTPESSPPPTTTAGPVAAPPSPPAKAVSFTLRDADVELKAAFRALPVPEQQAWTAKAKERQAEIDREDAAAAAKEEATKEPRYPPVTAAAAAAAASAVAIQKSDKESSTARNLFEWVDVAGKAVSSPANDQFAVVVEVDGAAASPLLGSSTSAIQPQQTETNNCGSVVSASPTPNAAAATETCAVVDPATPTTTTVVAAAKRTYDRNYAKKLAEFSRSRKWCLNEEQIKMCYDAGMEHYDQVMRTVTARDLMRELQDGFDLLRERGHGRFDMELPVFESPAFQFMNSIKTSPWMPVVREILGKDVVLIHKGMFLSMPGSAKQNYHQDGPHLTTQYQKPCHAINVFVPLVDLTIDNGPTEFCLGSHILGHEEFDEEFVEIPTVKAGTPIIFDYRLGHRGLANGGKTCRPIVYCTYAAAVDGKEFRDSVNFSRKRYHKIGDLVEKGLTREERVLKRKRAIEEQQQQEELKMIEELPTQEEPETLQSGLDPDSVEYLTKKPRYISKEAERADL